MILTLGAQQELPAPPAEIADEVELWARQSGRHARLHFFPVSFRHGRIAQGTWVVRISLKPDDKRLKLYQERNRRSPEDGEVREPPTEDVWLHESDGKGGYRALNLTDMGASGVREFLEKGNMWSGRGQFGSLEEQLRKVNQDNEAARQKNRANAKDQALLRTADRRRSALGIPFVGVVADITPEGEST